MKLYNKILFYLGSVIAVVSCVGEQQAGFVVTEKNIQGYWQVSSASQVSNGVLYFFLKDNKLFARGVRVNMGLESGGVSWVCQHGDEGLRGKAVWAGLVFSDMQRDIRDPNFFYGGQMVSSFACRVMSPEVVFHSAEKGLFYVKKNKAFDDFDVYFDEDLVFQIEKVSKDEAMQGCIREIKLGDMDKWGDIVNSEEARLRMLKDMGLTRDQWLSLASQEKICGNV